MPRELKFEVFHSSAHTFQHFDRNPKLAIAGCARSNRRSRSQPLEHPKITFRHDPILTCVFLRSPMIMANHAKSWGAGTPYGSYVGKSLHLSADGCAPFEKPRKVRQPAPMHAHWKAARVRNICCRLRTFRLTGSYSSQSRTPKERAQDARQDGFTFAA